MCTNPRISIILKSSTWRNGQKSLQICSQVIEVLSYESTKPEVPIIVKPACWEIKLVNNYYLLPIILQPTVD